MKFSFKLVTTLIAVILTVCCIATVFAAADVTSFTDFPAGSWSDAALRAGVNNGLIQGKGDGTIAPRDYITRAETATIINRAFGATVRADISQYTDVSPSKWYYAEMQKAVNMRTVEGVSSTKINPEGYITREQVFTILARALVLSDADESKLMTFADESSVSSWARGYTAALVNRGYVNGNTENRLKPKDYITREEFAQIMHNIFKQYIVGEDYKLSNATYGTTVVRTPNLTLNNLVINGDLIVADGVGRGDITLKNVRVSGRILFRGGEGKVKIEDGTTTGQFVIVHDVNGTVNFHNYRTHPLFKNIVLDTHATFLKPVGGGGSATPEGPEEEKFTIEFDGKDYLVSKGGKLGDAEADGIKLSDAIANYKPEEGYTNKGFKDKATGKDIDLDAKASGNIVIEPKDYKTLYAIYNANGGTMKGESVYKDEANHFTNLDPYTLLTDKPIKDKNTFAGWYDNQECKGTPITTIPAGQVADVTLYAKWEPYAELTFEYNHTLSDADSVFIDVKIDKLPYGTDAITYISAQYSYLKDGTTEKAELTYVGVTTAHGGTLNGTDSEIILDGVSITSGGTLFTIEFSKAKDYAEDVTFNFGDVAINDGVGGYNKFPATFTPEGKQIYEIEFNGKTFIVFEGEKIGDAKQKDNTSYTLADAFNDYEGTLVDGTYNSIEFKTNTGKVVTKDYVVGAGENLTEITAKVDYIKYDVIYKGNGGTIDGKSEYTDPEANAYNTSYTLISKTDPRVKRDGYIFNGWYKEGTSSTEIIEEIPVNTKGPVTVIADWTEEAPTGDDSVLKFDWSKDEDAKTITVKVVLTNIPKNIDNLAAIEIHYTQTPSYLKWDKATKSATFGGTFIHNNKDGVLTWYNENDSITPEELNEKGGVLFTIVYPYDEFPSVEEIILSYNKDKTTLASSDFKEGTDYKLEDGKITFAKTCVIDFNETKYFVTKGGKLGDAKTTDGTKLSDVMANYKPKAGYENKGFKIKGTETKVDDDTIVTDSMDIEPDDEIIYYSVTYDAGDGAFADGKHTVVEEKAYTVEKDYTVKNLTPEREGYDFAGWYYDEGKWQEPAPAGSTISKETMKNITLYAKWEKIDDEPDMFTVTLYEGTNNNKGSYEIESGKKITKTQINEKLGDPNTYSKMKGYTDSDGNVHEIAPELWYMVDGEWEIFDPETVVIDRDIDIHLFTRFAIFYYDTDLEFKGVKIPRTELSIAYDSNTDVIKSVLDTLTAMSDSLEGTINKIEMATGIDIFQAALNKAAKLKIIDEDGNILNPEVPVPLHKLLTEELIMKQIDNYIDANINNEEFIAEILKNDTVVNMLLEDEDIRNKVLSDESMRNKLLTTAAIKNIIKSGNKPDGSNIIIDYVITNQTFKDKFIGSQAPFDYIVDDLKALYDKNEYHNMILDACVEFVIDVYFEQTISAPELVHYIDTVLDDPDFISDIEAKPELRSMFKDELKGLLTDLDNTETSQETRDEVYAEIRGNDVMQNAIIDAVLGNDDIMDDIMEEVRADLSSATSQYRDDVIAAVRTEFADPLSTLKTQIIETVKTDLALGASSTLRDTVITAITTDFNSATSQLKDTVITTAKTEITTSGSTLRDSILAEAATPGSDIAEYIKDYASTSDTIKQKIKPLVKDNADVKAQARTWISSNIAYIKDDIKTAIKTDVQALKIAIAKSDSTVSGADAQSMAEEYVSGTIPSGAKAEVDSKINAFFANHADVLDMVEDNFDTFYLASYDTIFDEIYADPDVFGKAYESYVSDSSKLEDAFDEYVSVPDNLEAAVDKFIQNTDNLADAVELFVDSASNLDIERAANVYIADDDNLISAVNTYIKDDDNLSIVFDIFKEDRTNLKKAFETYIADDGNLGDAIHTFATNTDVFDKFYEDHLSENAADPETFNELFEAYYHTHVHDVADKAWDNSDIQGLVMTYVRTYTDKMVQEYTSGNLAEKNKDLADTIYELLHEQFPAVIRQRYYEEDSTIKASVDLLIEEEGTKLIKQYANNEIDGTMETFIDGTIKENIGIIVDDYLDGKLDSDIEGLINAEIDSYMRKLVADYISNENDARKTLGDLIPTYAHSAVDAIKQTDAFKNTISDFTSGNGVRVNEENIMFISILSSLMGEYDFDKIMADFAPEKVIKLVNKVGHDLAAKYVNTLLDTFVDGIKDAEAKLQADLDKDIEGTEYKFTTTPRVRVYIMDDFVVDMYNKAMPKVADKLNSKELIAQNPYAQRLINKNWITELLDYDSTKVTDEVTGYSIKKGYYDRFDKEYGSPIVRYYDIVLENIVLLHDAVMWYGKSYPEATIEDKLDAVSALLGTYANKANDVIMHYINTGELPKGYTPYEIADKILDKVLGVNDKIDDAYDKFEDKYYENEDKILELVDKMKNFYTEKLDRDYTDLIDLKEISVYADGKAYPVYEIMLELYDENEAFTIDTLATAIADSDNYHGINAIEKGMNKFKSVIERFKYNPGTYEKKIVRDAYKATLESRNIKGKETGSHSVEVQRYFQYIINIIK